MPERTALPALLPGVLSAGLLLVLLLLAGCDAGPAYLATEAKERRLAELGVGSFDTTGTAPLAGVSARRAIRVPRFSPDDVDGDTASEGYRAFVRRCRGCHVLPSPGARAPWEWPGVVGRMGNRIDSAGLLPLARDEEDEILRFLRRHAGEGR